MSIFVSPPGRYGFHHYPGRLGLCFGCHRGFHHLIATISGYHRDCRRSHQLVAHTPAADDLPPPWLPHYRAWFPPFPLLPLAALVTVIALVCHKSVSLTDTATSIAVIIIVIATRATVVAATSAAVVGHHLVATITAVVSGPFRHYSPGRRGYRYCQRCCRLVVAAITTMVIIIIDCLETTAAGEPPP